MYIEPNSVIKIMKNVPLDNTYSHTIYFESLSSQLSYFSSPTVVKYTLTTQSYQRVVKGRMRIEIKADDLYDCNYLAFQNTNFGNKWFYAFITAVEYVNNSTSEIAFEIDVMQTYHFDYEIKDCFVEREHAMNDTIGANTLKEPVEVGGADVWANTEYYFTDWDVVIITNPGTLTKVAMFIKNITNGVIDWAQDIIDHGTPSTTRQNVLQTIIDFFSAVTNGISDFLEIPDSYGSIINNQYTGGIIWTKHLTFNEEQDAKDIGTFINESLLPKGYSISNIYMCPHEFIGASKFDPIRVDLESAYFNPPTQFAYMSKDTLYTPKNNKLFTSPYTYFRMTNNQGSNVDLAYERMATGNKYIDLYVNWINNVEATVQLPKYGRESSHEDRTTQITISNFPTCTWSEGGFGTVLASVVKDSASNILGSLSALSMPYTFSSNDKLQDRRYTNDLINFGNQQYNTSLNTMNSALGTTSSLRGNGSGGTDVTYGRLGFCFYGMAITGEQAEVIDNFFEHYGYSTLLNKVPNRNGRPHWNYVKTRDCYIVANAPSESVRKICSIYDNGITFWKNPSEVGNYNLNNH